MNIVFIQGKIVEEIEYKFIINSKNKAIAILKIELLNKSIITVKAYDKLADFCYSRLEKGQNLIIEGFLDSKMEIVATTIQK